MTARRAVRTADRSPCPRCRRLMLVPAARRRPVRLAARAGRRHPHRAAADPRLRAAAARGRRRLARVGDHDEQRRGRASTSSATSRTCASGCRWSSSRRSARSSVARSRSCWTSASCRCCSPCCSSTSRSRWPVVAARERSAAEPPVEDEDDPAGGGDRSWPGSLTRRSRRGRRRGCAVRSSRSSGSVRAGYRVRNLRFGILGATVARRRLRAPRDRRRDRQGAGDAPRDGRAAPGRDGDEQPDDRHHGGGQRDHLPHPRRHRSVRRRPDGVGVFIGRDVGSRIAHRDRRALPPLAVRRRAAVHGVPDGPASLA